MYGCMCVCIYVCMYAYIYSRFSQAYSSAQIRLDQIRKQQAESNTAVQLAYRQCLDEMRLDQEVVAGKAQSRIWQRFRQTYAKLWFSYATRLGSGAGGLVSHMAAVQVDICQALVQLCHPLRQRCRWFSQPCGSSLGRHAKLQFSYATRLGSGAGGLVSHVAAVQVGICQALVQRCQRTKPVNECVEGSDVCLWQIFLRLEQTRLDQLRLHQFG